MLDDSKTFFLSQVRACLPLRCITSSFNNTKCFQTEETNCCSFESEMFFPAIGWWLLSCALIISKMLPLLFCQQDTSSMVSKRIFTFWMVRPRDCRRFALHLWMQQRTVYWQWFLNCSWTLQWFSHQNCACFYCSSARQIFGFGHWPLHTKIFTDSLHF